MRSDSENYPPGEPKYKRIVRELTAEITGGRLAAFDPIPSERALMRRFGVARQTVRQALKSLQAAGLIRSRQGRGTYVSNTQFLRPKIGFVSGETEAVELVPRLAVELKALAETCRLELMKSDLRADDPAEVFQMAKDFARRLVEADVAGVIYRPIEFPRDAERLNAEILASFRQAEIPVVLVGRDICEEPRRSGCDVVGIDEYEAGRAIGRHLVETGARRIRFLVGPRPSAGVRARISGCASVLRQPERELVLRSAGKDAIALTGHLVADPEIDAFVCTSDAEARQLAANLLHLGLRVPEDVRVVGFADDVEAERGHPQLTTVHQPGAALARILLDRLRAIAADPLLPACRLEVHAPLIVRESTVGEAAAREWAEKVKRGEIPY